MERSNKNRIQFWFQNSRPVSLPQSLMPALTALFLTIAVEDFTLWSGVLAVVGAVFAHLGMNLLDDYFDYRNQEKGYRDTLAREGIRARTVKCPYLVEGQATLKQTMMAIIVFAIIALIPGVIVCIYRGWPLVLIVVIGVILGESYSGKPLQLGYHGFGELVIGVMFGPLLMAGVYYAACGHLDWNLWVPAISMGLLVTNILYVHSVLDQDADKRAGKATMAAVMGGKKKQMFLEGILVFVPYILTVIIVALRQVSPIYLLILITLPMAISMFRSVRAHQYHPDAPVKPSWYHGPMANWELICQGHMDWFMFRWYLARNMMTAFAAIYIICSIISVIVGKLI